jgi:hypothetical protein
LYDGLKSEYSPDRHNQLLAAIQKVPKDKQNQFGKYVEDALRFKAEHEFDIIKKDYEGLKKSYESLNNDPTITGITRLKQESADLSERLKDIKGVDKSSIDPDFDFDGLQAIVASYNKARNLLEECKRLTNASEDMRYADEIEQNKAEIMELIKDTENVKSYKEVIGEVENISLGQRPTLVLNFNSPDDLKYLQKVLKADGTIENGRFIGAVRLKGICSFDYKGKVGNRNIEGHGFYNGKELQINNKTYETDSLNGEVTHMVVYKK